MIKIAHGLMAGSYLFSGDGGPATNANFAGPSSVAVDSSRNVYVGDSNRVRMISGGVVSTVAGNGVFGFAADGVPATSSELAPKARCGSKGNTLHFGCGGRGPTVSPPAARPK